MENTDYRNWDNFKSEIDKVVKKNNGRFPSENRLREWGYSKLGAAVYKYHGGYNLIREKLGFCLVKKPNGYWQNPNNFEAELKEAIKQNNGGFPTQAILVKIGKKNLIHAITKFYGGMNVVREKFRFEIIKNPNGYWTWNRVKKRLEEIIEKVGEFPKQKILSELGENGLAIAIGRKYGGFNKVRKKMGYELNTHSKFYYKDWKVFERSMRKVIKENNGEFPSWGGLSRMRKTPLANAISLHHGGYYAVREKMGYEDKRKPDNYWKSWKNFEREFKEAIKLNHGNFPSYTQLEKMGKKGVIYAARKYHGGFSTIREKIGYNEKMRVKLAKELEDIVRGLVA